MHRYRIGASLLALLASLPFGQGRTSNANSTLAGPALISREDGRTGFICQGGARQVAPCTANATAPTNSTNQSYPFTISTTSAQGESYNLACTVTGQVTGCITTSFVDVIDPTHPRTVTVTFSTGSGGVGTVVLTATPTIYSTSPSWGTLNLAIGAFPVVSPKNRLIGATPNASNTIGFTVQNTSAAAVTYNLLATCAGTATSCTTSSAVTVNGGATAPVSVSYTAGAVNATGTLTLRATSAADQSLTDTGWVSITVGTQPPAVVADTRELGTVVERKQCLDIAVGKGAAYECGDLRLAHPLPSIQTLGKTRTPVLLYNSQHAHPFPLVPATVTLSSGVPLPDSVTAAVWSGNTLRSRSMWSSSDWSPGAARRIVVGYDALALPTGIDTVRLEVTNWYGGTAYPNSPSILLPVPIVNRSTSPFGAGWWLAGLERLDPQTKLWTEGDGSLRQYVPAGTGVWVAPSVDHPDTLLLEPGTNNFIRKVPGGVRVIFDPTGKHILTVNRASDTTFFSYGVSGKLENLEVPPRAYPLDPPRNYTFFYNASALDSVTAPGMVQPMRRRVNLTSSGSRIIQIRDWITDFSSTDVTFGYDTSFANRISSRTDWTSTPLTFAYDRAGKLSQATLSTIVTQFQPAESKGLANGAQSAVDTASAFTRIDGPRTDVGDTTQIWIDVFGSPRRIVDALGRETQLWRADARWPALVSKVRHPNGRIVGAVYNALGLDSLVTDSSRHVGSTFATTRYEYDPRWYAPTRVTQPMGDFAAYAYDSIGNQTKAWGNRGDTVFFRYGSFVNRALLTSDSMPLDGAPLGKGLHDSLTYDLMGNLSQSFTPTSWDRPNFRPAETDRYRDFLGRVIRVTTPVGAQLRDRYVEQTQVMYYDLLDRDTLSLSIGDSSYKSEKPNPNVIYCADWRFVYCYRFAAETLTVHKEYDPDGHLLSVTQSSRPIHITAAGLTNRYAYDFAGRQIAATAPDGLADSAQYDNAGNLVRSRNRRGYVESIVYDALNRKVLDFVPGSSTTLTRPPRATNSLLQFNGTYVLPLDTLRFSYDLAGNVARATNRDSWVTRVYDTSGTLHSEEQRIRTYSGTDSTSHVYLLSYDYDLNGRRVGLHHPAQLLQKPDGSMPVGGAGTWTGVVTYHYDAGGFLDTLTDFTRRAFALRYDRDGRLRTIRFPNGVIDSTVFDNNGRISQHLVNAADTASGGLGPPGGIIFATKYDRDDAGRIIEADNQRNMWRNWYSGLGRLEWSDESYCTYDWTSGFCRDSVGPTFWVRTKTELFRYDAAGNRTETTTPTQQMQLPVTHGYNAAGRLVVDSAESRQSSLYGYDLSGNQISSGRNRRESYCGDYGVQGACPYYLQPIYQEDKASYYDAANQLRAVDRVTETHAHLTAGGFEEYRYDAFGRRILRRWQSECVILTSGTSCADSANYEGHIERTVYDGDQILYEIRSPGALGTSAAVLESDNLDITPGGYFTNGNLQYARVVYLHGAGVDRALSVTRLGTLRGTISNLTMFLHANWRGEYTMGTDSVAHIDEFKCPNYGSLPNCVQPDFPAHEAAPYRERGRDDQAKYWWGSMLWTQLDQSSQVYMRNRYYDPQTGRFTQEDPIGIAGGLNLYGFAGGDPVNYSDPFGLCPLCETLGNLWNGKLPADRSSERKISSLRAEVQQPARQLVNRSAMIGHPIRIVEGYRSNAEQARLYAQGRTTPGRKVTKALPGLSYHNYGLAIDVYPLVGGSPNFEASMSDFFPIAAIGTSIGFGWGGNWKFTDPPHFELTGGRSVQELQAAGPWRIP
ncbi:MAG: RHS repeat-associated core domain-containing protein [Gemmatimonadaceae bacterium]